MGSLKNKMAAAKKLGYWKALPLAVEWRLYKWKNKRKPESPVAAGVSEESDERVHQYLRQQEEILQSVLASAAGQSFLEIGIGPEPAIRRVRLMLENQVRYVGCDFQYVCAHHRRILKKQGLMSDNIRFAPNRSGTYAWTLFQMAQRREQFDIIFLDGHHTFYVDFPAFVLADYLLKPGGRLLVDDIEWTLSFLRKNMARSFHDWNFYRRMYDFSQYDEEQQNVSHMKLIVNDVLVERLHYTRVDDASTPYRWLLQKPELRQLEKSLQA